MSWIFAAIGRDFDIDIGRAAWEPFRATRNLGANAEFPLEPKEIMENHDRASRSNDLLDAYYYIIF
jgi:hypothetical protein